MRQITATWMRGGTSKCWVFLGADLDVDGMSVDDVLLRIFGSPDPRQVDGVGGGTSTTSKAVILEPSNHPGIDVEYTFAQVGIEEAKVDWGSNCGNCSAVVAAFAVRAGWVATQDGQTTVRVRNTNTDQVILQHLPTPGGRVLDEPTTSIPGVPFPGAPVRMGFLDPAGRSTGTLFPSGKRTDQLHVAGRTVEVTMVDAGAPVVAVPAAQVGLVGDESPDVIDATPGLLEHLDEVRRTAAVAMGLAETQAMAARAVPKLALVSRSGADQNTDITVRMLSMGKVHPAVPITGSVALTMAAGEQGTVVRDLLEQAPGTDFRIGTPAGDVMTFRAQDDGRDVVGAVRTYRLLAEGAVMLPDSSSADLPATARDVPETRVAAGLPTDPNQEQSHYLTEDIMDDLTLTSLPPRGDPPDSAPPDDPSPPRRRTAIQIICGFTVAAVAATLFGGDLLNPAASTSDGNWAGETVEFLIPLAEGGGTDTWARFIGQELTRAVPGKPGFAPVNDAAGEGISGTNHFMSSARPDGTEVLVSTASTVVPYLLELPEVRYDFTELEPVLANGTGAVVYARTAAGVSSVESLKELSGKLRFGGIAATSLDLTTLLSFDLLGVDVDAVFGFEGRGPVNLALQRGEVDIDYQTTATYDASVEPLIKSRAAVPLYSLGQVDESGNIVRDPNFKDVPTVVEVYEQLNGKAPDPEKLAAYKSILALTYTYQKALWVPKETPKEAAGLLRETSAELGADSAFQKSAAEVLGGYPLDADADLRERIGDAYAVDKDVREYVRELLSSTYDIKID